MDSFLFLAIVSILSVFSIAKPLDENDEEITPELKFDDALTS